MTTSENALKSLLKHSSLYAWYIRTREFQQATSALRDFSEHDHQLQTFYARLLKPGDLCFDVGANMGKRTKTLLAVGAHVIAIEPQPNCVRALQTVFGGHPHFEIIPKGVGAADGTATLQVNQNSALSSLATDWIAAVRQSGRYKGWQWNGTQQITLTTLDHLIAKYGVPDFIKIDVRGYEQQVLAGLSVAIPCVSLGFTAERTDGIFACLDRLQVLAGDRALEFNYCEGESMYFSFDTWVNGEQMRAHLERFRENFRTFGDVYVRIVG